MYSVYMYIAQPTRGTCTHWKESSHVATATGDVDRFFWTCFLCHDANIQFVKARTGYSHLFFRELIQQPYCWVTIQHIILLNISQDIQVWIRPNSSDTIVPNPRPPRHGVRRHRLKELKCLPPGPIPPVLSTSPGDEHCIVVHVTPVQKNKKVAFMKFHVLQQQRLFWGNKVKMYLKKQRCKLKKHHNCWDCRKWTCTVLLKHSS